MPALAAARQPRHPGSSWFATPPARRLLLEEQRESIPLLTSCFGRAGLYLRCCDDAPAELSGNLLQSVLRLHRDGDALAGDLRCRDDELPLLRESVDLVYALHALEGSAAPADLIGEFERVLTPEGMVLLIGLNPFSPWRVRWSSSGLAPVAAGRCRAMLHDAGFEVVRHYGLGPMLPWLRERPWVPLPHAGRRDPWAVWRAAYLIQARKRRSTATPLRPRAPALAFDTGVRAG